MVRNSIWFAAIALAAIALAALAAPVSAQTVEECDWRASLQAVPEPWEEHTRTFANGNVRITLTDAIEPAAGAFHLAVQSPPYDELGGRQCRVVSMDGSIGFAGVAFAEMTSSYNPSTGLTLTMPISRYDDKSADFREQSLSVTINQATGDITTELQ